VVICDDCSSDGTLDFARQLAEGDERFRFISNPRRFGLVGNWNSCVNEARGEWIKFVFQDDTIAPSCLEKLLASCVRTGIPFGFCERDFIFDDSVPEARQDWFNRHKQRIHSDYHSSAVISPEQAIRIAANEPTHNLVGEPTVTLIKRSLFSEIGGFDEALIQLCDTEFWCRVMMNYGAAFVPESLAAFRVHAQSATTLNLQERAFRCQVLDSLVIRYRIAFGSQFKPMRNSEATGRCNLSLRMDCASYAAEAWRQATRTSNAATGNSSGRMLAEWNAVKSRCAGLQILVWPGLAIKLGRKVKTTINRKAI
jgi:glycosyltransferase involved in cell wall biosynthesis